jgi:precorrin-6A/cobalt-precorrin-6A reductase
MDQSSAMPKRILILGGTAEARDIASAALATGHSVVSSMAGVTSKPILPSGEMRVGGFGGADGLRDYIQSAHIDLVVDATHPFAAQISKNAAKATQNLIRFERPAWETEHGDHWISAQSLSHAASLLPANVRVFLTTGRKELATFIQRDDLSGVIRTIEPPADILPSSWTVLFDRPPHDLAAELALFKREAFTHLVTKNAGGNATFAKLEAARALGLPVVMIQRPVKPPCPTFSTVEALIDAINS